MSKHLQERLGRARAATAEADIDALLVSPGADLRYLTGYDALPLERLTCLVLPTHGEPVLLVPALEEPAALASPVGELGMDVISWQDSEDPYARAAALLAGRVRRVAVDNHMWAEKLMGLRAAMPTVQQTLAGPVLRELRMRKSPDEVSALRDAGQAIDRVHSAMGEWLRPGRTERQVGKDIAEAILSAGHARVDFVIVASGPNSASPHAELSDRVIQLGEPVVVDIGGTTPAGYCSDSTRTYVAGGDPPADFRAYYAVLQEAQQAQCDHVRPGVSAESVDQLGRGLIADAGYGEMFLHRTGHGIGVETHEEPYLVAGNRLLLEPGMAFSVEPGIYLNGRHGARIEDIVACTDTGGERLNQTHRGCTVLPA